MKFRSLIKCEIDVNFVDQEKAKAFFIDGDWKDIYYEFLDLEEAARHLAFAFHNAPEKLSEGGLFRDVDGFGEYFYSRDNKEWRLTDKYVPNGVGMPCGEIIISYESELQCSQAEEI
ncbi:hypothetical protein N9R79_09795 [Vibrio sp.]|nr:hypothetical protein [Vibrio sp.]